MNRIETHRQNTQLYCRTFCRIDELIETANASIKERRLGVDLQRVFFKLLVMITNIIVTVVVRCIKIKDFLSFVSRLQRDHVVNINIVLCTIIVTIANLVACIVLFYNCQTITNLATSCKVELQMTGARLLESTPSWFSTKLILNSEKLIFINSIDFSHSAHNLHLFRRPKTFDPGYEGTSSKVSGGLHSFCQKINI